jgi:hypothetical protein
MEYLVVFATTAMVAFSRPHRSAVSLENLSRGDTIKERRQIRSLR